MQRRMNFAGKLIAGVLIVAVIAAVVIGCAGSSKKDQQASQASDAEQKGTLSRTFYLVDEQGRKSGTLVMHPSGNAELRDENDQVVGKFSFNPAAAEETAAVTADAETAEAQAEAETGSAEAATEADASEAKPDDKDEEK